MPGMRQGNSMGLKRDIKKYSDERRRSFLDALDDCESVSVTDWEGGFLSDTKDREEFTEGQRNVIDRMIESYGHRIGAW